MITFDKASLIKSMSDVPGFTLAHLKGALELSLTDLKSLQVKDLSHLLLAYFTQPALFTNEQVDSILEMIERKLNETESYDIKVNQILVFNLAVHGAGTNSLWRSLFKVYDESMLKEGTPLIQGTYHIFSLIGFLMRDSYEV
jgi:hypothetical protein